MSQIYIDPGFNEKPDNLYCSEQCITDAGLDLNNPDSNIFPIDQEKFNIQKDVMGWKNNCSSCGKRLVDE